ncbi:lysis system i-spanin subunit Rz [Stenotrophomonas lactitubi]|uniref:lysis system i-spanin subunit Rz n=1 Tax=Stenotrophomonas lactitubi TaxID=2045214 RepID=UPI0022490543|nr:lysis system i-spanin subunit Rz [Stenotrophomonas lactitubi]MCX2892145.1 lysis system i-spanin subunit Rz [Stenotrophomonas lactitubi]
MNRIVIAIVAFVVWSAAMFGAGWSWRDDRSEGVAAKQLAAGAEAIADQVNKTRATEQSEALQLADIGAKHEEDRAAAETVPAAVVAGLRSGNLRLRDDLATCHTARLSEAAAGAIERDAHAELRPEVVGAAIRIVTDAEDHVRACQAVIQADRDQQ